MVCACLILAGRLFQTSGALQANPHVHEQHVVLATTFRSGLPQPLSSQIARRERERKFRSGATQTETSLLKQHAAGERVDLLDDYDFAERTITESDALLVNESMSGREEGQNGRREFPLSLVW